MSPFSHGEAHGGSDPTCGSDGGALRWLAGEAGPSDASSRWRVADTPAAAGKMLLAAVCALATLALTESIVLFAAALALPAFFSVSYGPALTESLENLETLAVWCGRDFALEEPVLVVLGDHVYSTNAPVNCAGQVLDTFARHGMATSGVALTPEGEIGGFGTVAAVELVDHQGTYAVSAIVEKPDVETARSRLRGLLQIL